MTEIIYVNSTTSPFVEPEIPGIMGGGVIPVFPE